MSGNYIKLIDDETGRAAACSIRLHSQAAAEIDADALEDWARRVRRVRHVRRALNACGIPAVASGLWLSTPSAFACGLYVSNVDGVRCAWVSDACDVIDD